MVPFVEFDGDIDNERAFGALEGFDPFGELAQIRRDAFDLLQINAPRAQMLGSR